MQLVNSIHESLPDIPINTIHGTVWDLHAKMPDKIYKPEKGVYRLVSLKENKSTSGINTKQVKIKETDFYPSFANYLVNDVEDCTKAISLGGSSFKDKWGTPDVIGVKRSKKSDLIKKEDEVVSAEIKIDSQGLITAFGQACAYQSFSHKAYIVIPKNSSDEDEARLESLCLIFGIGLILFDSTNVENPQYEIRVRPLKHEPDLFYVNKYLKNVEKELFE